jgi:N-hydroxyarylamine O-acetyltransferase
MSSLSYGIARTVNPAFDLDAYLTRIGHRSARDPDLATLAAIQLAHTRTLAFENLDPWLGRPVALDLAALQRKLVWQRRGGYCYEHNLLLGGALRALGFAVIDLAARVRWNIPSGVVRPRTHMLLLVGVGDDRFIVDAGFGGRTLTAPLVFGRRGAQATPHGHFRVQRGDGAWAVQVDLPNGGWTTLYHFTLEPQLLADYEMTSWYLCQHPDSVFRQALVAARQDAEGRWTLRDTQLSLHLPDGRVETRTLRSADALREALQIRFGLDLAPLDGLDARLAALVANAPD